MVLIAVAVMKQTGCLTRSYERLTLRRILINTERLAIICLMVMVLALQFSCASTGPVAEPTKTAAPLSIDQNPSPVVTDTVPPAEPTPGERYWQLRFAAALSKGVDDDLLEALERRFGQPDGNVPDIPDLSDYQGAGYRIASAESILDALTDLTAFERAAGEDLQDEINQLERDYPDIVSAIDEETFAEEVLIVRSAILDSLESLVSNAPEFSKIDLDSYREGTLRARNELEFVVFALDMDALADQSIADATGRLDAFHRMMDDNTDEVFLRERIMASEEMTRQLSDEHREYANRRMVRTLFFLLPAINNYFRYR